MAVRMFWIGLLIPNVAWLNHRMYTFPIPIWRFFLTVELFHTIPHTLNFIYQALGKHAYSFFFSYCQNQGSSWMTRMNYHPVTSRHMSVSAVGRRLQNVRHSTGYKSEAKALLFWSFYELRKSLTLSHFHWRWWRSVFFKTTDLFHKK